MATFGKRGSAHISPAPAAQPSPWTFRRLSAMAAGAILLTSFLSRPNPPSEAPAAAAAEATGPAYPEPDTLQQDIRPVVIPHVRCKAKYPLDHHMRDVCETQQNEAEYTSTTFQIDPDVGILCTKRYPEDWVMFVTCAQSQMSAKRPAADKPDRPRFDIGKKCREEWPNNYQMQDYCVERQDEAMARAGNWIDRDIAVLCTDEWPSDWTMFMHCVDGQTAAMRRLKY